jgi:hypothetical protein
MPYWNKEIKTDLNGAPVSQYWNEAIDDYEPVQGQHGASRVLLWGPDGTALLTQDNPGYVRLTGAGIIRNGVVGPKTIGTTPQEGCVGESRLANRVGLRVYVPHDLPVYYGYGPEVSTITGMPILPGSFKDWPFDKDAPVPVYFVAAAPVLVIFEEIAG